LAIENETALLKPIRDDVYIASKSRFKKIKLLFLKQYQVTSTFYIAGESKTQLSNWMTSCTMHWRLTSRRGQKSNKKCEEQERKHKSVPSKKI